MLLTQYLPNIRRQILPIEHLDYNSPSQDGRKPGLFSIIESSVEIQHIYSMKTKVKTYNSNVKSILMYGSECWKMTVADIKNCEEFQNRYLKRILQVFWPNEINNQVLRERTQEKHKALRKQL